MEIQMTRAVWSHAAGHRGLRIIAADADFLGTNHQAMTVSFAITEHHAIMGINGPLALWFETHITRFGVRIEKETVVSRDNRFFKAHVAKLVQCYSNKFEGARNKTQR